MVNWSILELPLTKRRGSEEAAQNHPRAVPHWRHKPKSKKEAKKGQEHDIFQLLGRGDEGHYERYERSGK